jgi:hypothetical protein
VSARAAAGALLSALLAGCGPAPAPCEASDWGAGLVEPLQAIDPEVIAAAERRWCLSSMLRRAALDTESAGRLRHELRHHDSLQSFVKAKPGVHDGVVLLHSYLAPAADEDPVQRHQLYCKQRTQESLEAELGAGVRGPARPCSDDNQALLAWAVAQLPSELAQRYHAAAPVLHLEDDALCERGDIWVGAEPCVERVEDGVRLRAVQLETPLWVPRLGGCSYCKTLSPRGALKLAVLLALEGP